MRNSSAKCLQVRLRILVFAGTVVSLILGGCTDFISPPDLSRLRREYSNPCIDDVVAAFAALPTAGAEIGFWAGDVNDEAAVIPWPRYSDATTNSLGLNNHFQGVQRLRSAPFLAVTGSDVHGRAGQVFLIEMASRGVGRWNSNLIQVPDPQEPTETQLQPDWNDTVRVRIDLDTDRWHAGGLSILGDLLAIAIDDGGDGGSRVMFYDVSKPDQPAPIGLIERSHPSADAVAVTRVEDGRYLVALRASEAYHFYISRSENFLGGFDPESFVAWEPGGLLPELRATTQLQNINLVNQCDGTLYMLGFRNNSTLSPTLPGDNKGYLYRIEFPGNDYTQVPEITEVATKVFDCGSNCNFDAAAGSFISDGGELLIYGATHWRYAVLDGKLPQPTVVRLREF